MNKIDEIEEFMKKIDTPFAVAIDEGDGNVSISAHGTGRDMLVLITGLIRECVPKVHQKTFMAIGATTLEKLSKEDE